LRKTFLTERYAFSLGKMGKILLRLDIFSLRKTILGKFVGEFTISTEYLSNWKGILIEIRKDWKYT
jgi:hypothetical protein